jgi:DNA-binding beta-propeller fold protein YncE
LLIGMVGALASATVVLSAAAAADQLPVLRFGSPGSEAGQVQAPGGLATAPTTGDVFVADTANNRIDRFSSEGTFELAFGWGVVDGSAELQVCTVACEVGNRGPGAGEMDEVVGVAVSPVDGDVYAVNRRDGRVQRFTAAGAFVEEFGGYGSETDEFFSPLPLADDIAVGPDGRVYVIDPNRGRVAVFAADGTLDSEFSAPPMRSVAVGPGGRVYLGNDSNIGVVYEYEESGGTWTFEREVTMGEVWSPGALAIAPTTGNLLVYTHSGFAASFEYELLELDGSGAIVETTKLPQIAPPPDETASFGLAASAVPTFPEHEPGAVYLSDRLADQIQVLAEGEPQEPRISGVALSNVGSGYADLTAELDPEGLPTEYSFEYGASAAYGSRFPAAPGTLPAGFEAQRLGAHLTGLVPATTYHFRLVATNAKGTVASPDQTFTTLPLGGGAFVLPDGRAYERVSPAEKGQNDVESRGGFSQHGIAGADGAGMAFVTVNAMPGSPTGSLLVTNIAKRGTGGWSSTVVSTPELNQTSIAEGQPIELSADLNQALVAGAVPLTPDAPEGMNVYVHTLSPPSYRLVTPEGAGAGLFSPFQNAVGAAADFSRVFFQSGNALTPDSPPSAFPGNLYEWDGTHLRNVGILPGEELPDQNGVTPYGPERRPVSEDGRAVVFGAEGAGGLQVYRRAGGETVEVSAPNPGVVDPAGPRPATFVGAAANGSSVFFTSAGALTADADTGDNGTETDLAPNLYRYDVASGELTDLTIDESGYERGAAVGNVVVAPSGEAAFFVAEGKLDAGATPGSPNLYRWSRAGGVQFIATVLPGDPVVTGTPAVEFAEGREVDTNAAGTAFVFDSSAGLAGRSAAAGIPEIYHWSTTEGLACVSCGAGLMRAGAGMPGPTLRLADAGGSGNPLSEDGRKVFFSTRDSLIPQDTNGKEDVYEWEGGTDFLITSGGAGSNSYFVDASPSGKDVFFATRERLVKSDVDDNIDVYDAREGGGFPEPPGEAPPCEGESCRPPSAAPPAAAQLGSRSFVGPSNRKHHHKKRKHRRKKHHGRKQHKGKSRHGHAAGKRG